MYDYSLEVKHENGVLSSDMKASVLGSQLITSYLLPELS
jgi:hypothetical protein